MIIKGNPAGSIKFWSAHLLRDGTNEKAEVREISGLLSEDLPSALREMQAIGAQSRCHGNFMYQANINPMANEHLTPRQWRDAVDTLEKNLGLEGHQRVVIEHVKNGRQHYHIVWNRVDVESLKVADMGGNWRIHEATARELEQRFGLTPTPSLENSPEKKSAQELYEIRAAERSGIDPRAMKAELTELWNKADNGQAFTEALEERGYILAKGDRRDFCVVDRAGDAHSLARRLDGVTTKAVREGMADIDRDALPDVEQARDIQRGRADRREASAQEISDLPAPSELPKKTEAAKTAEPTSLTKEWEAFWEKRRGGQETKKEPVIKSTEPIARLVPTHVEPSKAVSPAKSEGLRVIGATGSLADFVGGLLAGRRSTPNEHLTSDQAQRMKAQRKALAAIENIRDSMERGEGLKVEDIQNLTPSHLENIRLRGDDYVRSLIESMERNRAREIDYGRTRER